MDVSITLDQLQKRAAEAEEMIRILRKQFSEMRKVAAAKVFADEVICLKSENQQLEFQVDELLARLVHLEKQNGVLQVNIPGNACSILSNGNSAAATLDTSPAPPLKSTQEQEIPKEVPEDGPKKPDKKSKQRPSAQDKSSKQEEREADISRLDLRIGLILNAKKHPDAESLYVEEVDVGEGKNRIVVSGLVKHVPIEAMQNRLAVLLCNLKPAKMRGVTSEAMVMCASTPEKVEILIPPAGSVPGDKIVCEGFVGEPDKELNPKKKIFEKVAPYLKTDSNRNATYKGLPWRVSSKGVVMAPTLTDVQIK